MVNLHRKFVQNRRQNRIAGESETASKEVAKHDDFISFGSRDFLISRGTCVTYEKNPAASYSLISSAVTFDSPNTNAGGYSLIFSTV
jgi:hypothetical protein